MAVASKLARAARTAVSAADKKPARVRKKVSEKKPDRAQRESDRADELRKTKSDYSQRVRDRVGEVEAAAGRINARTGGADRFARRLETEALNVYNKPSITEGSRSFVRMQEAASEGSRKRAKRVVDLERKAREGDAKAAEKVAELDRKSASDYARSIRSRALSSSLTARGKKGKLKDSDMLIGNTTNGITKDGEIIGNPTPNQIAQAMKVRTRR